MPYWLHGILTLVATLLAIVGDFFLMLFVVGTTGNGSRKIEIIVEAPAQERRGAAHSRSSRPNRRTGLHRGEPRSGPTRFLPPAVHAGGA
jgi:hypothetical protein